MRFDEMELSMRVTKAREKEAEGVTPIISAGFARRGGIRALKVARCRARGVECAGAALTNYSVVDLAGPVVKRR